MFIADYHVVWQIYLATAVVCFIAGFFLFKGLWRPLHHILVVLIAVLLFSPTLVNGENDFLIYAPSSIIVILDIAFKTGNLAELAITNLIWHGAIGFGAYLVFATLLAIFHKATTKKAPNNEN